MQYNSELHTPAALSQRMKTESTEQVAAWAPEPFRTFSRKEKLICPILLVNSTRYKSGKIKEQHRVAKTYNCRFIR
jgi:hypothetical protein